MMSANKRMHKEWINTSKKKTFRTKSEERKRKYAFNRKSYYNAFIKTIII